MAIAQSVGTSGKAGRAVVIQVGYFWFDLATYWLPFHRIVWEYAPAAMGLATIGLIAWTAWRLSGPFASAFAAALGLAGSPLVLSTEVAQAYHGSTWFGTALLAAYLCWLLSSRAARPATMGISIAVAVIVGLATASDPLLGPAGDAPFVAAIFLVWRVRRNDSSRALISVAALTAAGIAAVTIVAVLADRLADLTSSFPRGLTHVVPREHLVGNLRQLVSGIFEVAGMPHTGSALGILLGLLLLTGVSLPVLWLITSIRGQMPAQLLVVIAFWSGSAVFVAGAFLFSDVPADFLENSARYLVGMFYVMVATVPLWAALDLKRAAALAAPATLLIIANAAAVERDAAAMAFEPSFSVGLATPIAFLEQHGLSKGYAAYDEAAPMSLKTDFRINVYPVTQVFVAAGDTCGSSSPNAICPYAYNSLSDWYRGRGGPTFILIDPYMVRLGQPPPDSLDLFPAVYKVGRFTIYVYTDDVATHMGTPQRFTRPMFG